MGNEYDVLAQNCPSRNAFADVTGRWGGLILRALEPTPQRFNEVRHRVEGISDRMLIQNLRSLERDGLVFRNARQSNPPYTEYSLTPNGAAVAARVRELIDLVEGLMPAIATAQTAYDAGESRA